MKTNMLRTASLLTGLMILAACGSDSATGPIEPSTGTGSPVGKYVMTYVDDMLVPAMYDEGPVTGGQIKRYWVSGEVTFKADSTFSIKLIGKTTGPGQSGNPSTTAWSGTWRLEPGGVELTNSGGKAHWTGTNNLGRVSAPGSYTKVNGGKDVVILHFDKQS